jgi:aminopeptidase
LEKLARVLVDYSVEAREGEQVVVFGEVGAEPLVKAIYARLLQVGAVPVLQLQLPGMQELFFEHAQDIHYETSRPSGASLPRRRTRRSGSRRRRTRGRWRTWTRPGSRRSPG